MARPRKPSVMLELSGAFNQNPQRRRPLEPKPNGPLGDPPGRLPVDARPFWGELASMVPAGVLTIADRWAVELACRLMEKATRETNSAALLELREGISSAELSTLRSLLGSLGMTPADRSKLSVPLGKQKNRFADLAEETRAATDRPN